MTKASHRPAETNGRPRRILVVDDHPVVRAGIVQFLAREPDLQVCGEAATIDEARRAVEQLAPDLVLLDLLLKKVNALELIRELTGRFPDLRILALSMMDEAVYATRCLRAGARGFIMKEEAPEELVGAISAVLEGDTYVSHRVAQDLLAAAHRTPNKHSAPNGSDPELDRLTNRELQVFELVGEGMKPRQIAGLLSISPRTVDAHKEHIRNKLGIDSSAALAKHAAQWNARTRA